MTGRLLRPKRGERHGAGMRNWPEFLCNAWPPSLRFGSRQARSLHLRGLWIRLDVPGSRVIRGLSSPIKTARNISRPTNDSASVLSRNLLALFGRSDSYFPAPRLKPVGEEEPGRSGIAPRWGSGWQPTSNNRGHSAGRQVRLPISFARPSYPVLTRDFFSVYTTNWNLKR